MPRQPLQDIPGLPPYGQRSSERRKEQNRLAQRQLRERRIQQDAAQVLKLQQQQQEIQRLEGIVKSLVHENNFLKGHGGPRRRQSALPISSVSRGLAQFYGSTHEKELALPYLNYKPAFERHSIDCGSIQNFHNNAPVISSFLRDPFPLKECGSDDETGVNRSPLALAPPRSLFRGPQASSETFVPPAMACKNALPETSTANPRFGWEHGAIAGYPPDEFNGSSPPQAQVSCPWFTLPSANNFIPTPGPTAPPKPYVNDPARTFEGDAGISPKAQFSSDLASQLLATSTSPPSQSKSCTRLGDLDNFASFTQDEISSKLFSCSPYQFFGCRPQPRKASDSTGSDASSSSNSLGLYSDLAPSFPQMSSSSLEFPFNTPDVMLNAA